MTKTTNRPQANPKKNLEQARQQRAAKRQARRRLRTGLGIAALLILAGVAYWMITSRPKTLPAGVIPDRRPAAGDPMPEMALPMLNGQMVNTNEFLGKPILINAWATWCPPCKDEMPLLDSLQQQYKDQGLVVLAVNSADDIEVVEEFLETSDKFSFTVLIDSSGEALAKLGVQALPTSILIGADGIVKYIHIGEITKDLLETLVIPKLGLIASQ